MTVFTEDLQIKMTKFLVINDRLYDAATIIIKYKLH